MSALATRGLRALLAATLVALASRTPAADLWRLTGPAVPATLVAADAAGVTFGLGKSKELSVPWPELVRWGAPAELADPTDVERRQSAATGREPEWLLRPAGILYASPESYADDRFGLGSAAFFSVGVGRAELHGVILAPNVSPDERLALRAWALLAKEHDRVRLTNGDELTGQLTRFGERDLSFSTEAATFELPLERVAALAFAQAATPAAAGNTWVGLADGSRLQVAGLRVEAEQAVLEMPGGEAWQTFREQIVFLQPRNPQVVYLSELEPESYRQLPFLGAPWPTYGRNENVAGQPLRSAVALHLYGLGVHSAAQLTYRLDRPFRRFNALAAVDRAAGGRGSAEFRVFVDRGDGRWIERFASGVVRGGQPPLPIDVDLAGAKRLRLVVDYADRGDELDYADWLEARLTP